MNNNKFFAIIVCIIIAVAATYLGGVQKIIGAPMIGLLIGMLVVNILPTLDKEFKAGTYVSISLSLFSDRKYFYNEARNH
jgi:uncharacterized membrane protein YadS